MMQIPDQNLIILNKDELRAYISEMKNQIVNELRKELQPQRQYMSANETENMLRVTHGTLWNWAKRGLIHPHKIEGKVLYSRSEIQKIIETNNKEEICKS